MRPLMPDRQEARLWKGGKIWTEVSVTVGGNPLQHLRAKFAAIMKHVPFKICWIPYNPKGMKDDALSGGYYGACIGLKNLDDHLKVIQALCQLYEHDHKAFDSLLVIDARQEIIGDLPDDEHAPVIPMDDIISGTRVHRSPGDEAAFDIARGPNQKEDANIPMYASAEIVEEPCKAFKVSMADLTILTFEHEFFYPAIHTKNAKLSNPQSTMALMNQIHPLHVHFVKKSSNITRLQYLLSMEAYQYDKTLRPATKKKFTDRLQRRYAYSERKRYDLDAASDIDWLAAPFKDKMSFTYKEHYKQMDRKYKIDHVVHKKWKEVYDKDPVMEDDWNTALQRLINEKFSQSLFEAQDDPDAKHRAAMMRYWVEEIPYKTPIFKPLLPADCIGYCPKILAELYESDRQLGLLD